MQFMPQKVIKCQVVAYFLVDRPVLGSSKLYNNLLNDIAEVCMTHASPEEQVLRLFFDDTSKMGPIGNIVVRLGVVLVSPITRNSSCILIK